MSRTIAAFLSTFTSPYHKEILLGASDGARSRGYNFIGYSGQTLNLDNEDARLRSEVFNYINTDLVEGILITSSSLSRSSRPEQFDAFMKRYDEYKIITLGSEYGDYTSMNPDNDLGMTSLVDHLVEVHQCKRILLVRAEKLNLTSDQREQAYRRALENHGIFPDPNWIFCTGLRDEDGTMAAHMILESGVEFDAVLTVNDKIAIALINEFKKLGVRIPEDKLVCGFQGTFPSHFSTPPLTTVYENAYRQGYVAAQTLIEQIEGREVEKRIKLPVDLIIRKSCGCKGLSVVDRTTIDEYGYYEASCQVEKASASIKDFVQTRHSNEEFVDEMQARLDKIFQTFTLDNKIQSEKLITILRRIAYSVTVGDDLSECIDLLSKMIDLKHCYIMKFDFEGNRDTAYIHKAYVDNQHVDLSEYNREVPTSKLIPKALLPREETYSFVVEPLSFRGVPLGYIIFDNSHRNGTIFEVVQTIISSTLFFDRQYIAVEKARERFSDIALSSSDWLWEVDNELKVKFSSEGVERVIGYTVDEIRGKSLFEYTQGDQEEHLSSILNDHIGTQTAFKEIEIVYLHKDGEPVWLVISGRPIISYGETVGYRGVFRDITVRKQLMIEQSRFAAVGEMMGIIAHQWRQPLSNISTSSTKMKAFMQLGVEPKVPYEEMLDHINRDAQFLSKTIDDFRNFFKKNTIETACDINDLIEKTLDILDHSLKYYGITITSHYELKTKVIARGNELMQVFLNLIKNAYDALVQKSIKGPEIIINTFEEADSVIITVEDNAGGIDLHVIKHIFDPYFTTKGALKGTGIGLYISRVIIHDHCKGKLWAENTPRGAKFYISLPISRP